MAEAISHIGDLKDRAIATPITTFVCAPAGFGKLQLLRLIADSWPCEMDVQFFDGWDHGEDPKAAARAIADCTPGTLIVVADAHAADVATLAKALERHTSRKYPAKVVVSFDALRAISLSVIMANSTTDIIDASALALGGQQRHTLLASIGRKIDRDKVERLAGSWPIASNLLVAQIQKSSERYRDALDSDLLRDAGLYDFVEQQILSTLSPGEYAALWHACLLDECERKVLRKIDQSDAIMIGLSHRLDGLIERTSDRFIINPAFKKCAAEYGALRDPDGYPDTLITLADHCSQLGYLVEAARLAAQARNPEKIIDYARDHDGLAIWLTAGFPALKAMVDYAGDTLARRSPLLQLFQCIIDLKSGRLRQAEENLATLINDPEIAAAMPDQIEVTRVTLLVYGCTLKRANETEALSRLIARPGGNLSWRTYLATLGCVARAQQGRFEEAELLISQAREDALASGLAYNLMFLHLHETGIQLAQGQVVKAKASLRLAQKQLAEDFSDDVNAKTVIAALSATTDFEAGKLASAKAALRRSKVLEPEAEAWFDIYFIAYDTLARAFVKDRPLGEVLDLLAEEQDKLNKRDLPRVAELVKGIAQNIAGDAMLVSDAKIARRPTFQLRPLEKEATWQEHEVFTLAQAHKMRLEGDVAGALDVLAQAKRKAIKQNLMRSCLRFELLRFAILHRMGSWEASLESLKWCLVVAAQTGMIQIFRDYTASVIERYREELSKTGDLTPQERTILARPRPANDTDEGRDLDELSERELEILGGLASGGTDKELARQFGISDNGVRYHLRNIFRKLHVHDRLSAVVAAQQEGLLERA